MVSAPAPPQCGGGGGSCDDPNLVCFESSSIFPKLQALL